MGIEEKRRAEFAGAAGRMHKRVTEWRKRHPQASFDEIAEAVSQERKQLMGGLIGELAMEESERVFDRICPECGGRLQNKGKKRRDVLHREGEVTIERDYYYCPACKQGVFPPGQ